MSKAKDAPRSAKPLAAVGTLCKGLEVRIESGLVAWLAGEA